LSNVVLKNDVVKKVTAPLLMQLKIMATHREVELWTQLVV